MPRHSAGLLPYRHRPGGGPEVFLAHMGGPFWARRPRAWSIVKGEYDPAAEDPLAAAEREFTEEIGVPAPVGERLDLGEVRQAGGKLVRVHAVATKSDLVLVASNTVEIEWPPRSGRRQRIPEVDRAEWLTVPEAREVLVAAQTAFLDRLLEHADRAR